MIYIGGQFSAQALADVVNHTGFIVMLHPVPESSDWIFVSMLHRYDDITPKPRQALSSSSARLKFE